MIEKNILISSMLLITLCLISGCASKKYETRLEGIQKQIGYLNESYDRLSGKINEIQDTLIVVQNEVESTKADSKGTLAGAQQPVKGKQSIKKKQEDNLEVLKQEEVPPLASTARLDPEIEKIPIFDIGAEKPDLGGKPGEIYRLENGEGFIKIEGAKKREAALKSAGGHPQTGSYEDPEEFYKAALESYSSRKFDKAIEGFSKFVKLFPEHDLADNAVYWTGESFVAAGEYALALPEFQRLAMQYPNGNKMPDALLMIGICYDRLKNKQAAADSWNKLVSLYPSSQAAKKAKKKLESVEPSKTI
jgi:tol-pal system protein YbgF